MADPLSKEIDTVMARAVTLPITSFSPGTPRVDGKEERLKAMIANLDSQHQKINARIIDASLAEEAAEETRPEIFADMPAEVLAVYQTMRRAKEYGDHAAESRKVLVDMLMKYEGRGAGVPRRSVDGGTAPRAAMAPVAPMAHMGPTVQNMAMDGVDMTGIASTAPTTVNASPTTSNIDASRDPRRR